MTYTYNPLLKLGFQKLGESGEQGLDNITYVESVTDLPNAVSGVITLEANHAYIITGDLDLNGLRLAMSSGTTLLGTSSETSRLTSTGLGAKELLTCNYENPIRHLTIYDVEFGFSSKFQGDRISLDWTGVNFINVPNVGVLDGAENFIFDKGTFINSGGLRIVSSIFTISFINSLFFNTNDATKPIMELAEDLIINRRFRMLFSSMIVNSSTGILLQPKVSIPPESFILNGVNFAGAGTYLSGITDSTLAHNVSDTVGINNSTAVANMYMKVNTVPTVFSVAGERNAVLGVTQANPFLQKFIHADKGNMVQYNSNITREFSATATFTVLAPNNQIIGFYIGICKSGNPIDPDTDRITESEVYITTNGARPDAGTIQCIRPLSQGDRVYVIVQNKNNTSDVIVEFLNLIVKKI